MEELEMTKRALVDFHMVYLRVKRGKRVQLLWPQRVSLKVLFPVAEPCVAVGAAIVHATGVKAWKNKFPTPLHVGAGDTVFLNMNRVTADGITLEELFSANAKVGWAKYGF